MTIAALLLGGSIAAAAKPRPLPASAGRWSITSTFAMGGLPVAPPPRTVDRCVTESDRHDPRALLAAIGAPEDDCTVETWSADAKSVRWTADCAGRYRGSAAGMLTFSRDAGAGELTIRIEDSRGEAHPVRYRIEATRREDCSP